jgi:hypothetical protein
MKKIYNKYPANILMIAMILFLNHFANGQNSLQACKDSYNRELGFYNKGQFERINNDLAGCINTFNSNKAYYRDDINGRNIIFKVYKLMISSYVKLRQGSLVLRKKYELAAFYAPVLTKQQVETKLASTVLEAIK